MATQHACALFSHQASIVSPASEALKRRIRAELERDDAVNGKQQSKVEVCSSWRTSMTSYHGTTTLPRKCPGHNR